ncbi:thioredoxin [Aeromicrobium sp. Root495]|uniref:thioredoxin family protein n=1 Tax=Aeromicrobium sp. Root495 TaxID=1736550 RepID=UPI0006F71699|nr:thioredoxin family protein [Aeromicrobium sp. Root495]KQY58382.1 thioredoxin [Aeromicrobium sp. Root495]
MTGLVVLVVALTLSVVLGLLYQRRNGRFRETAPTVPVPAGRPDDAVRLSAQQIGVPLGTEATLVQFSTAFCSPCRATKALLSDVVSRETGVVHVEIDAESHLDLVRELDIMRTPTVLVLDPAGVVVRRASGLPRRDQVLTTLAAVRAGVDLNK